MNRNLSVINSKESTVIKLYPDFISFNTAESNPSAVVTVAVNVAPGWRAW